MSLHTSVRFLLVVFMILNSKIENTLLNYQMSIKKMSLVNFQSKIHYFKDEFYKLEAIFFKTYGFSNWCHI